MTQHTRGKNHKRRYVVRRIIFGLNSKRAKGKLWGNFRVRMLLEEPYSQKEADAAAGLGTSSFYEALEARKEAERVAKESVKPMEDVE